MGTTAFREITDAKKNNFQLISAELLKMIPWIVFIYQLISYKEMVGPTLGSNGALDYIYVNEARNRTLLLFFTQTVSIVWQPEL